MHGHLYIVCNVHAHIMSFNYTIVTVYTLLFLHSQANGLVDPLCQVNRIDVVPCSPNPDNIPQPAEK